ncbi:MAG: hypothetical protein ACNA8H_05555 [Anaerolineales bacterium]
MPDIDLLEQMLDSHHSHSPDETIAAIVHPSPTVYQPTPAWRIPCQQSPMGR